MLLYALLHLTAQGIANALGMAVAEARRLLKI
jgi:transketolase